METQAETAWGARLPLWDGERLELAAYAWHATACFVVWLVVPLAGALVACSGNQLWKRLRSFGLGGPRGAWFAPVVACWSALLPLLWFASRRPGLRTLYPVIEPSLSASWLSYVAILMVTLLTVEFFFRGFLLFGLTSRFGNVGVWLMTVPYALIHLHKPPLEAFASVPGGVALGILALTTGSIWPGLVLHLGVALTLEIFSSWA